MKMPFNGSPLNQKEGAVRKLKATLQIETQSTE